MANVTAELPHMEDISFIGKLIAEAKFEGSVSHADVDQSRMMDTADPANTGSHCEIETLSSVNVSNIILDSEKKIKCSNFNRSRLITPLIEEENFIEEGGVITGGV